MLENVKGLPKGELHAHFNGLIETSVIIEALKSEATDDIKNIDLTSALTIDKPCGNLPDYLANWNLFRAIPRSRKTLHILAQSAFKSLTKQNIKFAEIRSSIIYIALLNEISTTEALRWMVEEINVSGAAFGIRAGLILTIPRGDASVESLRALMSAYKNLGRPTEIIGIDLAGNESDQFPPDLPNLFRKAKDEFGLGITVHAGETGVVENVAQAVNAFNADRIGHGTAAGKCEKTMELLRIKDVCVEVCPVSNRLTGAAPHGSEHPLVKFIEAEVPFVICSDNPSMHRENLNSDYLEFMSESKRWDLLEGMYQRQQKYSFMRSAV